MSKLPPRKKKKKRTKVDLRREWLVPDATGPLRYTGLRGIYWYWLSRDIRKKEWMTWDKLCLTCLKPIEDWRLADCGHIIASRFCGEFLRLNPINLTIQHKGCNNPRFCPQAGVSNAVHYDLRYGQGKFAELYAMRILHTKEPSQEEYRTLIRRLSSYQEALTLTTS